MRRSLFSVILLGAAGCGVEEDPWGASPAQEAENEARYRRLRAVVDSALAADPAMSLAAEGIYDIYRCDGACEPADTANVLGRRRIVLFRDSTSVEDYNGPSNGCEAWPKVDDALFQWTREPGGALTVASSGIDSGHSLRGVLRRDHFIAVETFWYEGEEHYLVLGWRRGPPDPQACKGEPASEWG